MAQWHTQWDLAKTKARGGRGGQLPAWQQSEVTARIGVGDHDSFKDFKQEDVGDFIRQLNKAIPPFQSAPPSSLINELVSSLCSDVDTWKAQGGGKPEYKDTEAWMKKHRPPQYNHVPHCNKTCINGGDVGCNAANNATYHDNHRKWRADHGLAPLGGGGGAPGGKHYDIAIRNLDGAFSVSAQIPFAVGDLIDGAMDACKGSCPDNKAADYSVISRVKQSGAERAWTDRTHEFTASFLQKNTVLIMFQKKEEEARKGAAAAAGGGLLRADEGCENAELRDYQESRLCHYVEGESKHNQPIESYWRQVREKVVDPILIRTQLLEMEGDYGGVT
eukprot:gene28096-35123_t